MNECDNWTWVGGSVSNLVLREVYHFIALRFINFYYITFRKIRSYCGFISSCFQWRNIQKLLRRRELVYIFSGSNFSKVGNLLVFPVHGHKVLDGFQIVSNVVPKIWGTEKWADDHTATSQ